jgi:hypothetical protein
LADEAQMLLRSAQYRARQFIDRSKLMKTLKYAVAALTLAALAIPAEAQQFGATQSFDAGIHAGIGGYGRLRFLNPNRPLDAPATSPLQAQTQDDYATQLQQEQRELLQQNPSGTTRPELAIGGQLSGFTPR